MRNVFTVDVEEYFHPTEVQRELGGAGWEDFSPRVEAATYRLLDLLAANGTHATFFVLGWVARQHPGLIREIHDAGHEVACHSFRHQLVYSLTPQQFREDTELARKAIEDACGASPRAYRAPSYSITAESMWALDILAELGFTHDSSIYPIWHDRYGIPGFSRHPRRMPTPSGEIIEVPVATVELRPGRVAPVGGGGYLRLLPYRYTAAGIRRVNQQEGQPVCLYVHPWEVDRDQPRLIHGLIGRLRSYTGLNGMCGKVGRLLSEFEFDTLSRVHPSGTPVGAN